MAKISLGRQKPVAANERNDLLSRHQERDEIDQSQQSQNEKTRQPIRGRFAHVHLVSAMRFAGLWSEEVLRHVAAQFRPGRKAAQIGGQEMNPAVNPADACLLRRSEKEL